MISCPALAFEMLKISLIMHFTEFLLLEGQLSGHFVGFYLKKEYNNEMLSQGFFFGFFFYVLVGC